MQRWCAALMTKADWKTQQLHQYNAEYNSSTIRFQLPTLRVMHHLTL
jgi:hypothetical protein